MEKINSLTLDFPLHYIYISYKDISRHDTKLQLILTYILRIRLKNCNNNLDFSFLSLGVLPLRILMHISLFLFVSHNGGL